MMPQPAQQQEDLPIPVDLVSEIIRKKDLVVKRNDMEENNHRNDH